MPDILKHGLRETPPDVVQIPDVDEPRWAPPESDDASDTPADECKEHDEEAGEADDADGTDDAEQTDKKGKRASKSEKKAPPAPPRYPTEEEIAEYCAREIEQLRRQTVERAHSEALMRKRREIEECIARADQLLEKMQQLQWDYFARYAQELKFLAVDIAEKMVIHRIEQDDTYLEKLLMQVIGNIKHTGWLDVELSEQAVGLIERLKEELKQPEYREIATVSVTPTPKDTCKVSTEEGTVVATVSVQAQNLRAAFAKEAAE